MSWVKLGEKLDEQVQVKKRQEIRRKFGATVHVPIVLAEVDKPTIDGSYGGWFTKGGTPISHPSAYSRSGWSNMTYECSTRRILVPPNFYCCAENNENRS